jgi:bifunctional non-homologous end joining protein LigD
MAEDRLRKYRSMRDFSVTAEPAGGKQPGRDGPTFVVQKHAARRLHYDVRFELDGVMPSWAVPKGPSYDPAVKRLAVHVEDHPLDYQSFEGTIPAGQYGGGSVIVWDRGTYQNITEKDGRPVALADAIRTGHFSVWINGAKLRGGWSFTRTSRPGQRQDSWIMVKRKDDHADADLDITASAPESVKTGRKVEALSEAAGPAADAEATWTRERATWSPPMLATLVKETPEGNWIYQRKYDGLRAVAVRNGDEVELWSRNHLSFKERFPVLVRALASLPVDNFTLDGEIVAYRDGRTGFETLQGRGGGEIVLEVFDVLHLLGRDTTGLALDDRCRLLAQVVPEGTPGLRAVPNLEGEPADLLEQARAQNWEGLVAKRADSRYSSGRSRDWRKLKCDASQELVIGGWTEPRGSRSHFGALLVGVYDPDGRLLYAGKVGSGFSQDSLDSLYLRLVERAQEKSPFTNAPRMRDAHWVRPELVGEFAFTEWTAEGKLRHPRFRGLRPDKAARDVRREVGPANPPGAGPS